jgi:hypothetical protein
MPYRPDITIADASGNTVAFIEVKAFHGTDVDIAARYLRNLLVHGGEAQAAFILLVTPETGYLWTQPDTVLREAPPSATFPMRQIIQHYLPTDSDQSRLRGPVLESLVEQWLADLVSGISDADTRPTALRTSGFLDALRDAQVSAHVSA